MKNPLSISCKKKILSGEKQNIFASARCGKSPCNIIKHYMYDNFMSHIS